MLGLARRDDAAVGEHDLGLEQVVDGQPVLAREIAVAAAERQPGDAGRRDDAGRHRQPVGAERAVDLALRAAGLDAHGPARRVGIDPLHGRQVDDQPAVAAAEPRPVVPAAADGQQEAPLAGMGHGRDHLLGGGAGHDPARPLVDHAVVERARLVVAGVVPADHAGAQRLGEVVGGVNVGHGTFSPSLVMPRRYCPEDTSPSRIAPFRRFGIALQGVLGCAARLTCRLARFALRPIERRTGSWTFSRT